MENVLKPFTHSKNKSRNIIVLAIAALLLGGGVYAGVSQQSGPQIQQNTLQQVPVKTAENETPPYTLFYGIWADDNSIIKAYNLETKKNFEIATLPQNIKRVTAFMPDSLYYINDTDVNDHGKELVKYTISSKQKSVVVKADTGFGIDDYYISPDGKYLVTWEVGMAQGSRQLNGGVSRVYTAVLTNPSVKNLLYNEEANKPVHYPRGITNEGKVVTDMFLPNSGPGWAYGMSTSDFTGQTKQDITSMVNGTYGRQPRMSPDGNNIVFAGYDGARGSGTEQISGYRRAVIHPNTIEVLSPQTLQRTKLQGLSSNFVFDDARFDQNGKTLIISQVKYRDPSFITDIRLYNLGDNSTVTVPNSANKRGFGMVSDSQVLAGKPLVSSQSMGNLGETYQFINSDFEIINVKDGKTTIIPLAYANMQYVALVPNEKVPGFGGMEEAMSTDTLQMHTFAFKPRLMPDRINLQARASSQISSISDKSVKGISILAQNPDPNVTLPMVNPTNPLYPTVSGAPTSSTAPTVTGPVATVTQPVASAAPTSNPSAMMAPQATVTQQPTGGAPTANPSGGISGMPNLSGVPSISGLPPMPDISELTPENIQKLIEWLQNLLGILEQQTQN